MCPVFSGCRNIHGTIHIKYKTQLSQNNHFKLGPSLFSILTLSLGFGNYHNFADMWYFIAFMALLMKNIPTLYNAIPTPSWLDEIVPSTLVWQAQDCRAPECRRKEHKKRKVRQLWGNKWGWRSAQQILTYMHNLVKEGADIEKPCCFWQMLF